MPLMWPTAWPSAGAITNAMSTGVARGRRMARGLRRLSASRRPVSVPRARSCVPVVGSGFRSHRPAGTSVVIAVICNSLLLRAHALAGEAQVDVVEVGRPRVDLDCRDTEAVEGADNVAHLPVVERHGERLAHDKRVVAGQRSGSKSTQRYGGVGRHPQLDDPFAELRKQLPWRCKVGDVSPVH